MLKFLLLLNCVFVCESSNILVVFPVPEKSHSLLGDSVVKILLEAGHEVTWVTPHPKDIKWPSLEYVDISSVLYHELDSDQIEKSIPGVAKPTVDMLQLGSYYARQTLKHPAVQQLMVNTTLHFDAVIAEWFYSGLLAPLASVFECPLIWYTPEDISWQTFGLMHGDSSLDFISHTISSPTYSLSERLYHLWSRLYLGVRNYYHFSSIELPAYEESYRSFFEVRKRVLPNYELLVFNSSLLFVNSHPLLGEKKSLPINVKLVGGHHIDRIGSELPKNMKKLLNESKKGVIFVNLESYVAGKEVTDHIIQELIEVFGLMEQTVIWKYEEIIANLPQNIYMLEKPPQSSILNHPNTIVYINHGQMLPIIDATYFGVPIVGIPVLEDQIANTNSVVRRGCGIKVDFTNNLSWNVKEAVDAIINNSSYRSHSRSAKFIFRKQLTAPPADILHWVQLVLDTSGAGYLRSSTLLLSVLERYNLDIIILALLMFWFLTKVARLFRAHLVSDEENDKKNQ